MRFRNGLVFCAALLAVPVSADTIGEEKRYKFNRLSQSDFEVIRLQGMGATEYWCAAASYAIRRQGLPAQTKMYLKRGLGGSVKDPAARSVVFSFSPQGLTPQASQTWTIKQPGVSFKSSQGLRLCRDAFTRSTK
jgi:hypothetical protein